MAASNWQDSDFTPLTPSLGKGEVVSSILTGSTSTVSAKKPENTLFRGRLEHDPVKMNWVML
jgi:hypothetical protein